MGTKMYVRSSDSNSLSLFGNEDHGVSPFQRQRLDLPDAEIDFYPSLFRRSEADQLLTSLVTDIDWKQDKIKYYGQNLNLPRLTAWYGDPGKTYIYSGIRTDPKPWTDVLLIIKNRIEQACGHTFNSVLLNFYRNERDSVAWHSDDEPELGTNPIIGSVSLGATRSFMFRHKRNIELRGKIALTHGSFLLMAGSTQHNWVHQVPKTTKHLDKRINLTFRTIKA